MEAVAEYFHTLERRLDCPKDIRKNFLTKTRRTAEDFLQEKPDATRQDLDDFLGEPEELAQGFLETLDQEILECYHRRKRYFLYACVAVLIVALVGVSIWGVHLVRTPKVVETTDTIIVYS